MSERSPISGVGAGRELRCEPGVSWAMFGVGSRCGAEGGCMARKYVSIKEVAARAGVSFQTASKVLNGGDVRVSAETAARIVAAAEKLGYRPNTVARRLVQQTTATNGLITGD